MTRRNWMGPFVAFLALNAPNSVSAGMPWYTAADLTRSITQTVAEPTRLRLEAISFFLLALALCTVVVRWLWNSLRREFAWLPRLSYGKSLGVVVLWGLLFVIVLTMISGARELMTPGAWERAGSTYRLADDSATIEDQITTRHEAIGRLAEELIDHARANRKIFPTLETVQEIDASLLKVPGTSGERYVYLGGRWIDWEEDQSESRILAYEPGAFGPERLVVMTDGGIRWMPIGEIERALDQEKP